MNRRASRTLRDVDSQVVNALRISVILCTNSHERTDLLREALASLERQTLTPHELLVVVDHDERLLKSVERAVRSMTGFPARAVRNTYAAGLSGARNTGVDQASGEILAFIDDDAIASDDWLETLADGYRDARVWGVGGRVLPRWLATRPPWLAEELFWVIGCTYKGMPVERADVRNLHGCNASFRRQLFAEVGRFSPALGRRGTFLAGAEETELCLRATAIRPDKAFLFLPDAVVYHAVTAERTTWSYFLSRCFAEGRSKAWMVRSTGLMGLSDEFRYLQGIPTVAGRLMLRGGRSGDPHLFARGAALLIGSAATIAGFLSEEPRLIRRDESTAAGIPRSSSDGLERTLAVSAIICTYSPARWPLLCDAIESLERQTLAPLEIIVAVDHHPELAARIRKMFPQIRVVENTGPRGLSGGRNTAIAASRGEIVAFLDDDAAAAPTWLEQLCSSFSNPNVVGVGGRTSPAWSTARPTWWAEEFDWVVGASYRGMPQKRRFVRNVHGGNAAFRRSLFNEVGGFLPDVGRVLALPYGGEETELCIRTRRLIPHARFVHEPAAQILHHVPAGRTTLKYFVSRCFREGISKAQIAHTEGIRVGLRTESAYVSRLLPDAAIRAIVGLMRGE